MSASKFLGLVHACNKDTTSRVDQMNICFEERTAVKLNEAVMLRGKELSKNQKPRLTALLYFT
jgi:hypothetical protein